MNLVRYEDDHVVVTPDLLNIEPFNEIAEHKDAGKYFTFIFCLCDWKSPYAVKDYQQRYNELIDDILDGKKPTKLLQKGVDKYKELNQTDSSLLLESARKAVRTLREYFEEADPQAEKDPGKSAKDLMSNLKSVGDIIQKIDQWEDQIKREQSKSKTRKGVEVNKYNE